MLTYSLTSSCNGNKSWNDLTTEEKVTVVVVWVLLVTLIVWAWVRAVNCSKKNTQMRVTHLLFASIDPVLYLIFSYFIDGVCQ